MPDQQAPPTGQPAVSPPTNQPDPCSPRSYQETPGADKNELGGFSSEVMPTGSAGSIGNIETNIVKTESVDSYDSIEYSPRSHDPFPPTIPDDTTVKPAVPEPVRSETDITMGGAADDGSEGSREKVKQEEVSSKSDIKMDITMEGAEDDGSEGSQEKVKQEEVSSKSDIKIDIIMEGAEGDGSEGSQEKIKQEEVSSKSDIKMDINTQGAENDRSEGSQKIKQEEVSSKSDIKMDINTQGAAGDGSEGPQEKIKQEEVSSKSDTKTDITMEGADGDGSEGSQEKIKQEEVSPKSDIDRPPPADATSQMETPTQGERKPTNLDFLGAAQENQSNPDSEWQFSSGDEVSDEEASSADEEDSDEEGRYSPMNAAEMAQLLMREDGGYDNSPSVCAPHRSKNEISEDEAEPDKPNILLTQDMAIKPAGFVKSIVGKLVLIEASDPGHQRVLGEGSVLALEDRTILGVINEVLGRVEMPLYTVRFKSPEEIKELGVTVECKVFSVVQHSEFVFTQPLKAIKGSDASNIHDEEIPISEQEFSDDEAEAEHRRSLKEARQDKRGDRGGGRSDSGGSSARNSSTRSGYGGGRGWGSREPVPTHIDEPYIPLARPANLQEMYTSPPPPPPGPRGDQRGSNRRRGDRGWGRGSHRGNDSFAGRGARRGSHSQNDSGRPQLPPSVPTFNPNIQSSQPSPSFQQPHPYTFPPQWPAPEQQAEFIQLMQGQTSQWPSTRQFPIGPFSLPLHQQYQQFQQQGPHSAGQSNPQQPQFHSLPTGTYINPAFWGGQGQVPQAQAPQAQTNYSPPTSTQQVPTSADETATTRTVRESLEILKNLSK